MKTKENTPGPWILATIAGQERDCLMLGGGDGSDPVIADFRCDNHNVEDDARLCRAAPQVLALFYEAVAELHLAAAKAGARKDAKEREHLSAKANQLSRELRNALNNQS